MMKKFKIEICESVTHVYMVEAETEEEAYEIAWNNPASDKVLRHKEYPGDAETVGIYEVNDWLDIS
jgi:hypothetical protein